MKLSVSSLRTGPLLSIYYNPVPAAGGRPFCKKFLSYHDVRKKSETPHPTMDEYQKQRLLDIIDEFRRNLGDYRLTAAVLSAYEVAQAMRMQEAGEWLRMELRGYTASDLDGGFSEVMEETERNAFLKRGWRNRTTTAHIYLVLPTGQFQSREVTLGVPLPIQNLEMAVERQTGGLLRVDAPPPPELLDFLRRSGIGVPQSPVTFDITAGDIDRMLHGLYDLLLEFYQTARDLVE